MEKKKATIINISFKTKTLEDNMLLDWLEAKFEEYGKSNYIKLILKKEMLKEIKQD